MLFVVICFEKIFLLLIVSKESSKLLEKEKGNLS